MADSPTHSTSSVAFQAANAARTNVEDIAAMNAAAALRHPGMLLKSQSKWQVMVEEPFREPPYWLFESAD